LGPLAVWLHGSALLFRLRSGGIPLSEDWRPYSATSTAAACGTWSLGAALRAMVACDFATPRPQGRGTLTATRCHLQQEGVEADAKTPAVEVAPRPARCVWLMGAEQLGQLSSPSGRARLSSHVEGQWRAGARQRSGGIRSRRAQCFATMVRSPQAIHCRSDRPCHGRAVASAVPSLGPGGRPALR